MASRSSAEIARGSTAGTGAAGYDPTVEDAAPTAPATLTEADAGMVGRLVVTATRIAAEQGLAEGGYRLVFNSGDDGGQTVHHLHLHILGGRRLGALG